MTDKMFKVVDSSATAEYPNRSHDVLVNGQVKRVTFTFGQATELPAEVALKFHKAGFTVLNDDGQVYNAPVVPDPVLETRLKPGEVIARYEELEVEALRLRAAVLPNGETVIKAPKDEVIAFLMKDLQGQSNSIKAVDDLEMSEDGQAGGTLDDLTDNLQAPAPAPTPAVEVQAPAPAPTPEPAPQAQAPAAAPGAMFNE